jgi:hypothetical protein
MNKLILSNIIRFFAVMLLQVLVFNYLNLFGFINPFVYLLFILLLPFETPAWLLLILAFFTGISVDMFVNTGGIHAAASLAVGFARPILLRTLVSKREFETGIKPGVADLGWKWFLSYAGISILLHSLIVFYLDFLSFASFFTTFRQALSQAAATLFFIILFEFLANIRKR